MGPPDIFEASIRWNSWALPLAVTLSFEWQHCIVSVGPLTLAWRWSEDVIAAHNERVAKEVG